MKKYLLSSTAQNRSLLPFFFLVLLLSIPIWVAGPVAERLLGKGLPVDIPISSLMAVTPVIAAMILVWRENGSGAVKKLLKGAFSHKRITRKIWYLPIFLLMPVIVALQYGVVNPMRVPIPDSQFPIVMVPVSCALFFVAALTEEGGWQGYAIERLLARWNALPASIVLGMVWATWHIVPLIQLGRTPAQIVWQCLDMVATRILIVWLYNNTGKSVLAAVLYHMMYNVSTLVLPNFGLQYNPSATSILVVIAAAAVKVLWDPKTLTQYRYARSDQGIQSKTGSA